ncbi:REP-associated tyrosine transposase [Dawidia soli]|uniref:Transposase n=1 Tax=Dawidia soli TaxID=2782352 RepID=A0AAP2GEH0_9BACT|nr:transposase [Dawidia soli]MBT1688372.1 transposase [Dawidia soli]
MSRKYKFRDQEAVYFVTFTTIYWLDIFIRQEYKDIFLNSLRYCQENKGLELYAYCIMSSHVHLIIARRGRPELQDIVRDIKKYTATSIIHAIQNNPQESRRDLLMWLFEKEGKFNNDNERYQFWQRHSHPIELNTEEKLYQRMEYIHNNPVGAGIVSQPEYYLYSSTASYGGLSGGLIEVMLI